MTTYDPIDHLSDWTTEALEVRAAQTNDPRVLAEIDRRADLALAQLRRDAEKREIDDTIRLLWDLSDIARAEEIAIGPHDDARALRFHAVRRWCAAWADYAEFQRAERFPAP